MKGPVLFSDFCDVSSASEEKNIYKLVYDPS